MEFSEDSLFQSVWDIKQPHEKIFRVTNPVLFFTCYQIIRQLIVENSRKKYPEYGEYTLRKLSHKLSFELFNLAFLIDEPVYQQLIFQKERLKPIMTQDNICFDHGQNNKTLN